MITKFTVNPPGVVSQATLPVLPKGSEQPANVGAKSGGQHR